VTHRPLLGGLDLVRGSVTIIGLRVALLLLASLPGLAMILGAVAGPARQPYFTDVQGRLPMFHLSRLSGELSGAMGGATALALLLALLGEQLLVAGGLHWLAPDHPREGSAWRSVLRTGGGWLWPMLRVVLLAVLHAAVGLKLLAIGIDCLSRHGEVAGWSGLTLKATLPVLQGGLALLWLSLVGAWAFWCRLLLVADERRTVRGAWHLAARVLWRRPLRAALFYMLVTLLAQAAGGAVLALWRQSPPATATGALLWIATWLLALVLGAFLWHWLLRAGRLLYADPRFDDLRQRPDGPIGVVAALRRLVRRLRRRRA